MNRIAISRTCKKLNKKWKIVGSKINGEDNKGLKRSEEMPSEPKRPVIDRKKKGRIEKLDHNRRV